MFEEKNDFETTKEIEELSDLNNQIYEVNSAPLEKKEESIEEKHQSDFFTPPKKRKWKDKIKSWWQKRSKKQKIFILVGTFFVLVFLLAGIFFLIGKRNKKEEIPKQPEVILQEENYRYENGTLIFLNANKEEIGKYNCENQNEELCFVSYYSAEDAFDVEKQIYEDNTPVLTRSAIIDNTYVFINDNPKKDEERIKVYNMKTNFSDAIYKKVKKVDANKYILKNETNLYGLVEFKNNEILTKLDFTYSYLGFTPNEKNYYISVQNNRNFVIDETGKNISKAIEGTIKNINDQYIKVQLDNGKYEVYNYNNQNIFKESYDYAELYDDYVALLNDTKLYLKFYDKNKLNEEAISLTTKDYVKTSIYDKNNTLKETKESFAIEENGDIITITIKNNEETSTKMINKAEGVLNKSLRNLNYFDGKLYIYSNTEKTELLGSYNCSNKNNVTKGDKNLKNCTLAQDTIFEDNDYEIPGSVGAIPIFNQRFIFISDNPELVNETNQNIVLYDLKKSTNLGKYREVNTYSYTGTKEITFSTVTDLQVVAKNQSGNYGVIKINLTDIAGHIGFNYSSIEKLRDYYVAKDANGYLLLSKNNGASLTSAIPYKIRNYGKDYVKVVHNGNYYIYDFKGKQITKTGLKYIELYDNFFAGVDTNNKLGIYTYEKSDKNILSGNELIQLNLNKYYGNGMLAFKVSGNEILVGHENAYVPAPQQIVLPVEE